MVMLQADSRVEDDLASIVVAAAQAVIEEARRRQRRRWLLRSVAALVAALAIGLVLAFSGGGAGSSPRQYPSSGPKGSRLMFAQSATMEGTFLGIGGPVHARPMQLSGTIRFVSEHGHRIYTTKATDGRWTIKVPTGTYTVEGLSKQVNGGRNWSTASVITVGGGRTHSNVRVIYGTIR